MNAWLMLVSSAPGSNPAARMRIWRALKASGACALRDGVYVLPRSGAATAMFEEQARAVAAIGGTAQIVSFDSTDPSQQAELERLFDHSEDYAALFGKLDAIKSGLATVDEIEARRQLAAMRREAAALAAIDYFPGPARLQIEQALADAEALANRRFSPDEPHAASGHVTSCNRVEFQGRTWATRRRLWVDRVASAWLIRRFIDAEARFLWLEHPQDCPALALGFDFDGARFSHVGPRVTFEVLVASFALDSDEGLARLGALVHYLDVGGAPVPEAAGFTAILTGARAQATDDDALLAAMSTVLDSLYASYGQPSRSDTSSTKLNENAVPEP
ncbi:chromate resistance protein ChrB domain-containing protein [Luteimonas soli]|uniref:Chromate resistance protein ChrB domain-containing protein n=1 Tax=Luteimonas soli TaxID=1648966 RepID=A0ABV7XJU4_9GAMM